MTPEERAFKLCRDLHTASPDCYGIAAAIRAAENDAIERAAVAADEWDEFFDRSVGDVIRALKHEAPK